MKRLSISSKLPLIDAIIRGKNKIRQSVTLTGSGCWLAPYVPKPGGYGQMYWRNEKWGTHRLAYRLCVLQWSRDYTARRAQRASFHSTAVQRDG